MTSFDIPEPASFDRFIVDNVTLDKVWDYTRMTFFYQKILGYNRNIRIDLRRKEPKAIEFVKEVEALRDRAVEEELIHLKAVYQFFPAVSEGNDIIVSNGNEDIIFHFQRQEEEPYLCLSDYLQHDKDSMGFMVGTAGKEILDYAKELEKEGKFKEAFIFQGISLGAAEALTEMIHHRMRITWGLAEPLWDKKRGPPRNYRGERYSFGYPACPDMSKQEKLWKLLQPQDIGVNITESYMMEPEDSVSCIVFHHPEAKYFNI